MREFNALNQQPQQDDQSQQPSRLQSQQSTLYWNEPNEFEELHDVVALKELDDNEKLQDAVATDVLDDYEELQSPFAFGETNNDFQELQGADERMELFVDEDLSLFREPTDDLQEAREFDGEQMKMDANAALVGRIQNQFRTTKNKK